MSLSSVDIRRPARRMGESSRTDPWWGKPLLVFLGFSAFIVYSTWAALQNAHYDFHNYLSPFYSPLIFGEGSHAWIEGQPSWWPAILPFSPAIFILWAPGGFRFTCYYYRGAYYKSFWGDPAACAVGEWRKKFLGENSLPLILQNLHRYFLYVAIVFLGVLSYDAWLAMWFPTADGGKEFGIGVGTIVLTLNVVFLSGYTLGCHSLRHLVGGVLDKFSSSPGRKKAYDCVSCLNRGHNRWAWASLFWVGFTDLYVRLLSMQVFGYDGANGWTDWRLF